MRRGQILLDNRRHVARRERVQVEDIFDGNGDRFPSPVRGGVGGRGTDRQMRGPAITCFCQWS